MTTSDHASNNAARVSFGQQYLEAAVMTASPWRLRLMLIERGVDVARRLAEDWRRGENLGANERSLQLLDLLSELLGGIRRGVGQRDQPVCRQVADLYVFLMQYLMEAEMTSDAAMIDEIQIVLETEAGTWQSVCAQQSTSKPLFDNRSPKTPGRLNLEG